MSTALVVRDDAGALDRAERSSVVSHMDFEQIVAMGDQLVRTGFLPKHIKNGAQAAAIVLAGQELGMPPMRALRSLMLVEGKVVENADSQLSRFKADGGRAVFKQLDEQGAALWLRHPNGDEHEESFSIEDARRAGLAGKQVWKSYPKAMLRSRVITAGLKSIGWEGGVGAYDPDEAAAFAPPAAQSAVASVSRATDATGENADVTDVSDMVEEAPEIVATIDWALAFQLPGSAKAWNGNGGKPLGELSPSMIPGIRSWIDGKIRELEEKEEEAPPVHYELRKACDLILAMRKAEAEKDQVKMFDETAAAPAAGSGENPTKLAPGKVEDALEKPADSTATITRLSKRINKMLQHEKLSAPEREDFLKRSAAAQSADDLQRLVIELEELIASPI